jgi:hypothetical protein
VPGATRRDGNEVAAVAIDVPDAAPDVRRLCVALFEGGVRLAEYLHHIRSCEEGMRAIDYAWQIVCTSAVTDPKLIAGCLLRLGMANLTCGCRPTTIGHRRRTPIRDAHQIRDMRTLDQVRGGLATLIGALPYETGPAPSHRMPAKEEGRR